MAMRQQTLLLNPVWSIRISFYADPDPAFYPNLDQNPGRQTNADPDPGQTVELQQFEF
jgi:hypothetical protein